MRAKGRMAELAPHMVDGVLGGLPVRQWVLTLPYRLRYALVTWSPARDAETDLTNTAAGPDNVGARVRSAVVRSTTDPVAGDNRQGTSQTLRAAEPVPLFYTDLANGAELLQRTAEDRVQDLLRAHHDLLATAAARYGGAAVRWLGDGLLSMFASPAEALSCAVAMQQEARRQAPRRRLALRIGLHAGTVPRGEADYFATPVLVARELCQAAPAGAILCSDVVVELLNGQRHAFSIRDRGALDVPGLSTAVRIRGACVHQSFVPVMFTLSPEFSHPFNTACAI